MVFRSPDSRTWSAVIHSLPSSIYASRLRPGRTGRHFSSRIGVLLIALLMMPAISCADEYVGGLPLTTVKTGTVTGDLWIDATPPPYFPFSYTKTFTLPAASVASPGRIQWARLYVSAYAMNMQTDYKFNVTTRWDGDNVTGYEKVWIEPGHAGFTFLKDGGNDNSAFAGHGTGEPYKMINDHEIRVTSDYFLWYDVKDLINNQTIFVDYPLSLDTTDGRVKMITLVVAYDDPDAATRTQYWVNQGEDECSYYQDTEWNSKRSRVAVGTTAFSTGSADPFTSATLTVNYIASHNGVYAFPKATNDNCTVHWGCNPPTLTFQYPLASGYDVQEPFSGVMHWDVTSGILPGQDSTLAYARDVSQTGQAGFYKLPLAFLVLKNPLPPSANFTANTTSGATPLAVRFNDTSRAGVPSTWAWNFGDGGTSALKDPVHLYTTTGNYTITFTTANTAGSDTMTRTGYINVSDSQPAALIAAFTNTTPRSGAAPLTVQFRDISTGSPLTWNWTFGDTGSGNTSTIQNPSHTYTEPGVYSVNLTITGAGGSNSTRSTAYVSVSSVSGVPVAAFSATPVSGTAPLTVQFSDLSVGSPTSWEWDFNNDGVIENTTRNPTYTYTSSGSYTVRLRAINAAGSDDETRTGFVTVYTQPVVSVLPLTQSVGVDSTRFYEVIMDQAPTGIAGQDLTVSLNNPGIAEITGITYPPWAQLTRSPILPNQTIVVGGTDINHLVEPGAHGVILANITVRGNTTGVTQLSVSAVHMDDDNEGVQVIPLTSSGTVIVGSYTGPVAAFTANTTSGPADLTVQFTDQSLGSPTSWAWDFNNDGLIDSPFQNPSCTYTSAGTYSVNLTVANNAGSHSLVKSGYITVTAGSGAAPVAAFAASPTSGAAPLAVTFSDQSTGSPASWYWEFGDGSTSTDKNPLHRYASIGTYTVNLTATNTVGSHTLTKNRYITVTAVNASAPVAAFSANPASGTAPLSVTFTDQSTGSPTGWNWDFGNGQTSSLSTKTITYTSAGIYTVTLTASNSHGSTIATRTITVNTATGLPGVAFTADPVSGVAPLTVSFTDQTSGSPTSWKWDFNNDGTTDSTLQNPTYTYSSAGTYTVRLTATNTAGSDSLIKNSYISATSSSDTPDLIINSVVPNLGRAGGSIFSLEQNPVNINIENSGTGVSTTTTVKLQSGDGFSGTATVPSIAAGSSVTVAVTDTTVRTGEGASVTYTVTVDPDNLNTESSESNNVKTGSFTTRYNGYKGKRYWTGNSDVITRHTFDLHGGLVHSFGNSAYQSAGDETVSWQASDLPVPSGATVKAAYLYVPYTWDNDHTAPDKITLDFNSQRVSRSNWFHDKSNFGNYADYEYGLIVYDVTPSFQKNAANSAAFKRTSTSGKISPYGFTLAVVYEDSSASHKQIFINEEFDLLGASASQYGTTPAEATAYVPFTGMTVDRSGVKSATLITFVPSAITEGNLLFNGNTVASNVWDYGSTAGPQVAVATRDVTSYLQSTGNSAGIQSTDSGDTRDTPCMAAAQQFLVVDLGGSTTTTPTVTTTITQTTETIVTLGPESTVSLASSQGPAPGNGPAGGTNTGTSQNTASGIQENHYQAGPAEKSEAPEGNGRSPSSSAPEETGIPMGLVLGGFCMIGATSAIAYRNGWIANGQTGTRVIWEDDGSRFSCQWVDIASGRVCYRASQLQGISRKTQVLTVIALAGILIIAGVSYGLIHSPSAGYSIQASASDTPLAGSFDIIPTIEDIKDLDLTDHKPAYPPGFSARNGLLFVYHGTRPLQVADLALQLSKGTVLMTLTPETVPSPVNAVNTHLSSYFEEMGNGNGILEEGEWLMAYADNCYDSSASTSEPRGRVLVWQPQDAPPGLEVPVTDTVGYSLKDTADGRILQQGTLTFLPATP